jgi:hypothetical protein
MRTFLLSLRRLYYVYIIGSFVLYKTEVSVVFSRTAILLATIDYFVLRNEMEENVGNKVTSTVIWWFILLNTVRKIIQIYLKE